MTRLIDADAFRREIDTYPPFDKETQDSNAMANLAKESLLVALNNTPTIDIEPHWIPCSERLPEDDRSKVVTLANGNAEVGYYSNGDWWCVGDEITLENQTVIAWMPLPEPYEVNHE